MPIYNKEKLAEYLSFYNRDAKIEYKGKIYSVTEKDFNQLNVRGNYWHGKTDPSSWLVMATVSHFKRKFKKLARLQLIALAAQVLNVDAAKIESSLDWSAQYMAWHEGGKPEEYHVLPPE
jgi:hypothetical protein